MNTFRKRTALRIATVSVVLATVATPIAWFVSRENAEEEVVSFAIEESRRLLLHHQAIRFDGPDAMARAESAAQTLVGGLFEIAEVYTADGQRLAEAMTDAGMQIETLLPKHPPPRYVQTSYENLRTGGDSWIIRVFVPLRQDAGPISGYFEGVRSIPQWQKQQIVSDAFVVAMMVCLASLACGGVLYPVVVNLSADNERKAREVLESHLAMMEALGRAIAKRDSDTGAHNFRVAWVSAMLGESVGLAGSSMQSLIAGSFLHDAGKIGIPDAILLKPGKLDREEMDVMRTHVLLGEEIVSGVGWLDGARDVVAYHHEKWDGTGYPHRLAGEGIPLAARIFAIADVFDALCSKRPYKESLPYDEVMRILTQDAGSHFDPSLVDTFAGMSRSIYERSAQLGEEGARRLMEDMVRKHFGVLGPNHPPDL